MTSSHVRRIGARTAGAALGQGAAWAQPARPVPAADRHQHILSDEIIALAGPDSGLQALPAKEVVALLDAAGIRKAVLLSTAYMYGSPRRQLADEYAQVRRENDWTAAQAAQYPGGLVAFCGIAPFKVYALEEIRRCARQPGLKRILYGTDSAQGDNLRPREAWAAFRRLPLSEAEFAQLASNEAPYLE